MIELIMDTRNDVVDADMILDILASMRNHYESVTMKIERGLFIIHAWDRKP